MLNKDLEGCSHDLFQAIISYDRLRKTMNTISQDSNLA